MNKVFSLTKRDDPSEAAAELRISGPIGSSWWDDTGTSAKQFVEALDSIPKGRPITLHVNSEGGSVQDGLEIYHAIRARSADVTAKITGYALSIASVIPLAAGRVISPSGSVWMLHKPWSVSSGNADDMRKAAEMLDKHEEALVAIYSEETGQKPKKIAEDLSAELWMTGEEAVAYGLADEISDEPVTLAALDGTRFRRMPAAMGAVSPHNTNTQKGSIMDPNTEPSAVATPQPPAPLNDDITTPQAAKLMAEIVNLRERLERERKDKIERQVDSAIADGRITRDARDFWVKSAVSDEASLQVLAGMPRQPVTEPRPHNAAISGGKDAVDSLQSIPTAQDRFRFAVANWNDIRSAERRRGGVQAANTHSGLSTITGTMIADGVTTVLQNRCAALQAVARDFSINPMVPRQPVVFRQVQAGGTAQSNATSFEDTTNFVGTVEPITITPAQLTAGAHITNAELNSGLRMADWVTVKGCELANKIMAAVAAIITTGNFTATPLVAAAVSFGPSDLRTLYGQLKKAFRKSLVLDGEYFAQLLPATREDYNVTEGSNWPGWDGVYLNTVWTGATANTVGVALDPGQAIACAAGIPAIPDSASRSGLNVSSFTVPGLELSVAMCSWFSTSTRTDWMTLDVVFGAAKNDGTAAVLIKSA